MSNDKLSQTNVSKFVFSKRVINSELFKHHNIKKIFDYIYNKDVELVEVKILLRKANIKLRTEGIQLYIRRSSDKQAENLICVTTR